MANKHVKKHLTPSLTREIYSGSKNSFTCIGVTEVRVPTEPSAGEPVEQLQLSHTAGSLCRIVLK